jgi:hypothetical protein
MSQLNVARGVTLSMSIFCASSTLTLDEILQFFAEQLDIIVDRKTTNISFNITLRYQVFLIRSTLCIRL